MKTILCLMLTMSAAAASAQEKNAHELVTEANARLTAGEFDKALESYKAAEVTMPESPELAYNQGIAYYRLRDFSKAHDAFNRALLTRDRGLEEKIKYNLGNVAYAGAMEKTSADLQQAIDSLKTAIGHFRDALEIDPTDEDAKANIQMAQVLIKDLLDKLKKQQEEQKQKQDQNKDQQQEQKDQQEQQGDQQKDQQEKQDDQEKKDQQKGGEQDQKQDQKQDQQQQQQGGEQKDEQSQEQQAQAQPKDAREMTPEESERMLQAVRDKERQRRDELAKRRRVQRVPVNKDW